MPCNTCLTRCCQHLKLCTARMHCSCGIADGSLLGDHVCSLLRLHRATAASDACLTPGCLVRGHQHLCNAPVPGAVLTACMVRPPHHPIQEPDCGVMRQVRQDSLLELCDGCFSTPRAWPCPLACASGSCLMVGMVVLGDAHELWRCAFLEPHTSSKSGGTSSRQESSVNVRAVSPCYVQRVRTLLLTLTQA